MHRRLGWWLTLIFADAMGGWAVLVVNQGATIPSEHLARVFDRFYRVDASRSGAGRNHGLGLAIVAAIARMHGGQTTAKSADGTTSIGLCINTPGRQ